MGRFYPTETANSIGFQYKVNIWGNLEASGRFWWIDAAHAESGFVRIVGFTPVGVVDLRRFRVRSRTSLTIVGSLYRFRSRSFAMFMADLTRNVIDISMEPKPLVLLPPALEVTLAYQVSV